MKKSTVLIIGASLAGLAAAACLKKKGIAFLIIEKESEIGSPWRNHYERLHLHTNRQLSVLPYKKWQEIVPLYPSRRHVIDYIEEYQKTFDIHPDFNTEAISIQKVNDHWITETRNEQIQSSYLILATGAYGNPKPYHFKGMETFPGKILHSSQYHSGRDFKGQRVLIAGFGNSACEIAIDLYEHLAKPAMSVRSPVNVIPRDWMGIPILRISQLINKLPPRVADMLVAPILNYCYGDLEKLGLRKLPYGPFQQIHQDRRSPVLDIGTIDLIRNGGIEIHGELLEISGRTVHFSDGSGGEFDAIVAAIGYSRGITFPTHLGNERFEEILKPVRQQRMYGKDGLYFCGFRIGPVGAIREIFSDSKRIAAHIAAT